MSTAFMISAERSSATSPARPTTAPLPIAVTSTPAAVASSFTSSSSRAVAPNETRFLASPSSNHPASISTAGVPILLQTSKYSGKPYSRNP